MTEELALPLEVRRVTLNLAKGAAGLLVSGLRPKYFSPMTMAAIVITSADRANIKTCLFRLAERSKYLMLDVRVPAPTSLVGTAGAWVVANIDCSVLVDIALLFESNGSERSTCASKSSRRFNSFRSLSSSLAV